MYGDGGADGSKDELAGPQSEDEDEDAYEDADEGKGEAAASQRTT